MDGDPAHPDARALLHRVLESTPDLVSVVGPDYRYRFVNAAYETCHSRSTEDIIGATVADVLGSDTFESIIRPRLDRCLAGDDLDYESWFDIASGRRFLSVRYAPLRGDGGRIDGVLVIARDMTARKLAEQGLRESEDKYRRYIAHAPHGIFVADREGRYLEANPAALEMTGYSEAELRARTIRDLVPPHNQHRVGPGFARLLNDGYFEQRVQLQRKDGSTFFVNMSTVRLNDDRFISFCDDISDELQME